MDQQNFDLWPAFQSEYLFPFCTVNSCRKPAFRGPYTRSVHEEQSGSIGCDDVMISILINYTTDMHMNDSTTLRRLPACARFCLHGLTVVHNVSAGAGHLYTAQTHTHTHTSDGIHLKMIHRVRPSRPSVDRQTRSRLPKFSSLLYLPGAPVT